MIFTKRFIRLLIRNLRRVPHFLVLVVRWIGDHGHRKTPRKYAESPYVEQLRKMIDDHEELSNADELLSALILEVYADSQTTKRTLHREVIEGRVKYIVLVVLFVITAVFVGKVNDLARSNREAIRVGCVLNSNLVLLSGGGARSDPNSPTIKLQSEYRAQIERRMSPDQLQRVENLKLEIARAGGALPIPNCDAVASDPGSVRAVTIPTPTPRKTP